ncbi:MAG TPA: tyrosine-type recombinase/integrase [Thermoanaerobaculia bacterium]|jgi:integrase
MKEPRFFLVKRRGRWWARVVYDDPVTGKPRELTRAARTRAEASDVGSRLVRDLNQTHGRSAARERATFGDLADEYGRSHVRPAEYHAGRKIAGLRGLAAAKNRLATLRAHFGARLLRSITFGDLAHFKEVRLKVPTNRGTERSIASVHRELEMLRAMLGFAVREGWITTNPFTAAKGLISHADEKQRERILTREEETRLLAATDHPKRAHLRPILICALDTGMRFGEIVKLRWEDVELFEKTIRVRAMNTKTMRERSLAMTERLHRELLRLSANRTGDELVFGIMSNVKRSFVAARAEAGIPEVRFHDLRHTAATRLCQGLPLPQVGRILGHVQPSTTYRYVNADAETARRGALILDQLNGESASTQTAAEVTN